MANSMLHHHSNHTWVYVMHFTLSDLFCPHNSSRGRYCLLPCKTEKTEVHRDTFLSHLLYLTILYCLSGENYSLKNGLSKSPQSIYIHYNSQSSTVSQKVLQGDNHLWKDVIISHSKIPSIRPLKVMFPYRNLSSTRQTI